MSPPAATLEKEDHVRDAEFNKAMHGKSAQAEGGFRAMLQKDKAAQNAAVDEYFKHWDNKAAGDETEETRKVRYKVDTCDIPDLHVDIFRLAVTNTLPSQGTTTTSQRICMSTAGARVSTSVAMPSANLSTRRLHATNITLHT